MTQLSLEELATLGAGTVVMFWTGAVSELGIQKSRYNKDSIEERSDTNKKIVPGVASLVCFYEAMSDPAYLSGLLLPAAYSLGAHMSGRIFERSSSNSYKPKPFLYLI